MKKANAERRKQTLLTGDNDPELLPHWHPNQLRHTKATEVRLRFCLDGAQVIMGHAKADVTQVYAEKSSALAVEIARKIG